ncbi:CynX/NimT family MFS transporter [Stutzerimonas kirkiae]|uniref:MFS transporter n=1 Tax=Stutzerimonas kirkiae TaxID=2211392 RepID=A0A4Q9R9E3_9GAMM|nr:MFS transporter [Stutzerimonas kirkiae]TBU96788.1 MFS transporter [Stutzerimonas kirkiae]TBV01029.1 MFS transporter [Stutzerimonas kirkiae]TBV08377.1 MFS transporter [Stutzerimonas kirkiae]TBV16648.1 MFS transporter [Stutzerimonas kirkiae]
MNAETHRGPSLTGLSTLLVMAMGMPMMIFYAIGILGPRLISELGISHQQLGWLTTSTFGLAAILSPWAGTLVQRMGTRAGLVGLFLLVGLSFSLMALLPGFGGLVTALLFCGIAQSLANPATNQAIAQGVPAPRKAAIVGLKQSGVQASALLAGVLLPPLVVAWGWRGALATWVPIALLMALLAVRWVPARATQAQYRSLRVSAPNAWLALLMAIQLCAGLALSSFMTFLGVHADQLGVSAQTIGAMVGCFGVMGMLSRVLLTPIGARLKDESVLLGMLFVLASVALAIMRQADAQQHWPLWLGVIGMGSSVVASNAIAMSMLLRDERFGTAATSAGMLSVGFFAGFALGPPAFGWLLGHSDGFAAAWPSLIGILITGGVLCLLLFRMRQRG